MQPSKGRSPTLFGAMHRKGRLLIVLIWPDGSKSLIPGLDRPGLAHTNPSVHQPRQHSALWNTCCTHELPSMLSSAVALPSSPRPKFQRQPRRAFSQIVPTAAVCRAARDFYFQAERASLPLHALDMLSVRYRRLTEKGLPPFQICSLVGRSKAILHRLHSSSTITVRSR